MRLEFTFRRHHKLDETAADCADHIVADDRRGIFAVADGVSSAIFAGTWSSRLCHAALEAVPDELSANGLARWLMPLRSKMTDHIAAQVEGKPWYVTEKARDGASSTLMLGQYAWSESDCRLYLWNVGDCNLLWSRQDGNWQTWPLEAASGFDRMPPQLPSVVSPVRGFQRKVLPVHAGDVGVVATDAVAKWLLQSAALVERDERHGWLLSWVAAATASDEAWEQWVADTRLAGTLENDDSSVLIAEHVLSSSSAADLDWLLPPSQPADAYEDDTVTMVTQPVSAPEEVHSTDASGPAAPPAAHEGRPDCAPRPAALAASNAEAQGAALALSQEDTQRPYAASPPSTAPHSVSGGAVSNRPATTAWRDQLDFAVKLAPDLPTTGDRREKGWVQKKVKDLEKNEDQRLNAAHLISSALGHVRVELPSLRDGLVAHRAGRAAEGGPTLAQFIIGLGLSLEHGVKQLFTTENPIARQMSLQRLIAWWLVAQERTKASSPSERAVIYGLLEASWRDESDEGSA